MPDFLTILRDELTNDPWQTFLPSAGIIPFVSAAAAATAAVFFHSMLRR